MSGGPPRRGIGPESHNRGGSSRSDRGFQLRFDSFDRRKEWKPSNRPTNSGRPWNQSDQHNKKIVIDLWSSNKGTLLSHKVCQFQWKPVTKTKKPRVPHCFRCKCNGHTAGECNTFLDCVVCDKKDSHLSRKYPIVKMSKPHATLFGLGENDFNFQIWNIS